MFATPEQIELIKHKASEYDIDLSSEYAVFIFSDEESEIRCMLDDNIILTLTDSGSLKSGMFLINDETDIVRDNIRKSIKKKFTKKANIEQAKINMQKRLEQEAVKVIERKKHLNGKYKILKNKIENINLDNTYFSEIMVGDAEYDDKTCKTCMMPVNLKPKFTDKLIDVSFRLTMHTPYQEYIDNVVNHITDSYEAELNDYFNDIISQKICEYVKNQINIDYVYDERLDECHKYPKFMHMLIDIQNDNYVPAQINGLINGSMIEFSFNNADFIYNAETEDIVCKNKKNIENIIKAIKINQSSVIAAINLNPKYVQVSIWENGVSVTIGDKSNADSVRLKLGFRGKIDLNKVEQKLNNIEEIQSKYDKKNQSNSSIYENALAFDICELAKENKWKLNHKVISKLLRGKQISFYYDYKVTPACGLYEYVDAKDLSKIINELLRMKVLSIKTQCSLLVKGENFDKYINSINIIDESYSSYEKFTDAEWVNYMKHPREFEDENDMIEQMYVLDRIPLICRYRNLFEKFLQNKPLSWKLCWKKYISSMYAIEEGIKKDYWKVLNNLNSRGL